MENLSILWTGNSVTFAVMVDIVTEMVRLIEAQRAYETNSKMVQTAEDMMSVTNGIKR